MDGVYRQVLFSLLLGAVFCTGNGCVEKNNVSTPELTKPETKSADNSFSSDAIATRETTEASREIQSNSSETTPLQFSTFQTPPELDIEHVTQELVGFGISPVNALEAGIVGQKKSFWAWNPQRSMMFKMHTILQHKTERVNFFVEDGRFDLNLLLKSAEIIENLVLPQIEKMLEIQVNDEPISIIQGRIPGVSGYYSSIHEYSSTIYEFSNSGSMIFINLEQTPIGTPNYFGTIAHELQHLLHWRVDSTEDGWMNEGISELIVGSLGYDQLHVDAFTSDPTVSLIHWSGTQSNYGAVTLFLEYLFSHYLGEDALALLVNDRADGLESLDRVLKEQAKSIDFETIFQEWVIANYMDARGRPNAYDDRKVVIEPTHVLTKPGTLSGLVNQYAANYVEITPRDRAYSIEFQGNNVNPLVSAPDISDNILWWSNRGDSIDSVLVKEFDLSNVDKAMLEVDLWFDLEAYWDFAYIEISTDGGASWIILEGESSTRKDPFGQSLGAAYTGQSGGYTSRWLREVVDLSPFAGQKISLRFQVITDGVVNNQGVVIRRISVPEIEYFWDGEGDGCWNPHGFILTGNVVEQTYWVKTIEFTPDKRVSINHLQLDSERYGRVQFEGSFDEFSKVVLVVMAAAPGSSIPAPYTVTLRDIG